MDAKYEDRAEDFRPIVMVEDGVVGFARIISKVATPCSP